MASNVLELTTSVGRLVSGRPGVGITTDDKGQPLLFKSGKNAGQPATRYNFGVAFPKTPGVTHWSQEPSLGFVSGQAGQQWLPAVWTFGHAEYKAVAQHRDFAWKIIDGDSTEVNTKGTKPCDREGWPGHWVVFFTTYLKPQLVNANGTQVLTDDEAIRTGYYVQVIAEITPNNSTDSPGLYFNPRAVALAGYGQEIQGSGGVDTKNAGLGGAPLPAGASATPPAGVGATPPPPAPPAVPSAPAPVTPPPAVPAPVAPPAAPAPVAPMPHAVPTVAPAPVAPPAPPAPPAAPASPVMLPAANGVSYEAYKASGWSDEQLRSAGYMA